MLKTIRKSIKGQSTIEYIILITVLLLAWFVVSNYFKRGVSGRWKSAVDDLGDQYDPRITDSRIRHQLFSNTITTVTTQPADGGFYTERFDVSNTLERKDGYQWIGAY